MKQGVLTMKLTALTLMACALALLCAAPAAALTPTCRNNCRYLVVELQDPWYAIGDVRCDRGKVNETQSRRVKFKQGTDDGSRIECQIQFVRKSKQHPETNEVRFTQNRCVLKAGNIHVRQVSGRPPIYRDSEGCYKNNRAGKVIIKGFGENPQKPDWVPDLPK
jgi:hypothetical protein